MTAFEPPRVDSVPVLWRSETAVAVAKPWGLLVHNSTYAGRPERSLKQVLETQLGRSVQPIHRLDRGTSGVVLFALDPTPDRVSAWSTALGAPDTEKRYLALVRGRPAFESIEVDSPIRGEDGSEQPARSHFEVLARSSVERVSLVEAHIETGRRHQIRRHLAHLRHPVVNDSRHGDARFNRDLRARTRLARLALHGWCLSLTPPEEPARVCIQCPLVSDLASTFEQLFPNLNHQALRHAGPGELPSEV